jgi:hypothetical protein
MSSGSIWGASWREINNALDGYEAIRIADAVIVLLFRELVFFLFGNETPDLVSLNVAAGNVHDQVFSPVQSTSSRLIGCHDNKRVARAPSRPRRVKAWESALRYPLRQGGGHFDAQRDWGGLLRDGP